ncbi:CARDB domain-containing protein [Kingella potus]|uniref:CARDB domain-containing protein n=1 Tax=Kingella potus TaxID=265175 RepID=UPI001FD5ABC6|nr:CARDB domain-containing protein [Kingella potus]UOP01491.1 hypothetical protein LVJ84_04685 [Kingella potus]
MEVVNLSTGQTVASIDHQVAEVLFSDGLSAVREAEFSWPAGIQGTGRFEIKVGLDVRAQISEYGAGGEGDNTAFVLLENGSDLAVRNLTVDTASARAGGKVLLRWHDVNQGKTVAPSGFGDRVQVYAANADGSMGKQIINTSVVFTGEDARPLAAGESRARSFVFTLPDGAAGTGDFIVVVSADQNAAGQSLIFEVNDAGDAERNNSMQTGFHAAAVEYADLQADSLTVPENMASGQRVRVAWTVHNRGKVAAVGDWSDMLVLTQDAVTGNSDDIILARVPHKGGLAAGVTYSAEAMIDIPAGLHGRYRVAVITDADGSVLEPDSRNDNIRLSEPAVITAAHANLAVRDIALPESIYAGDTVSVSWRVENIGQADAGTRGWIDRVYLSHTSDPDGNAVLLGSYSHTGGLRAGGAYQAQMDVHIPPETVVGGYFLVVRTDALDAVKETGRRENNTQAAAVRIAAEKRPDLVLEGIRAPAIWVSGQTVTLSYTVRNLGNKDVDGVVYDSLRLVHKQDGQRVILLPVQQRLLRWRQEAAIRTAWTLWYPMMRNRRLAFGSYDR